MTGAFDFISQRSPPWDSCRSGTAHPRTCDTLSCAGTTWRICSITDASSTFGCPARRTQFSVFCGERGKSHTASLRCRGDKTMESATHEVSGAPELPITIKTTKQLLLLLLLFIFYFKWVSVILRRTALGNINWCFDELGIICVTPVGDINRLAVDVIGQRSRDVIGRQSFKPWCHWLYRQQVISAFGAVLFWCLLLK